MSWMAGSVDFMILQISDNLAIVLEWESAWGDVQFIMTYLYIIFISDYIIDLLIIWYLCIFCIYL